MQTAHPLTPYERLEALPETLVGECLDGVLHTQPRPAPRHLHISGQLDRTLGASYGDDDGPDGWWLLVEPEIHFERRVQVVVPDLAGWRRARLPDLPDTAFFECVPDWVCEILSPASARTDRAIKMPMFARYGVGWLWLVDPVGREIEAFATTDTGWQAVARAGGTGVTALPPFDAAPLDLDRLWRWRGGAGPPPS